MTLENIRAKLAEPAPRPGRYDLQARDEAGAWTVYLTLDKHDELSSLVWEISLGKTEAGSAALEERAVAIAKRVRGLVEPLKVYEIDSVNNVALLRSEEPTHREGKLFYYEVTLQDSTVVRVRRFQGWKDANQKRVQVAFALTNEVLGKLIEDLTAL